jgi:hypothetical protein
MALCILNGAKLRQRLKHFDRSLRHFSLAIVLGAAALF